MAAERGRRCDGDGFNHVKCGDAPVGGLLQRLVRRVHYGAAFGSLIGRSRSSASATLGPPLVFWATITFQPLSVFLATIVIRPKRFGCGEPSASFSPLITQLQ